jgi:hypothetical protein
MLEAINRAQAIYGIERITLAPSLDAVAVEFDASRLRVADIEATLRSCGLPVAQPAPPEPVVKIEPEPAPPAAPIQP